MFQDIYPHVFHNEYLPSSPAADDIVLIYKEDSVLMKDEDTFFSAGEFKAEELVFLFRIDSTAFFLSRQDIPGALSLPVRSFRLRDPQYMSFAVLTGWQLDRWYQEHAYCGRCGTALVPHEKERAMKCPACGGIVYPKIMPAVIVAVVNEKDELLVTRYAGSRSDHFALVAGFTEIGETIEETVIREVKEETGLDVFDLSYFASQPWSFSDTLLFGFWAHADSAQPICMDENELKLAEWRTRKTLPEPQDQISLTAHMIRTWLNNGQN